MLCGNFKEENISATIKEVRESAKEYRSLFTECSIYIEKIAKGSLKTKLLNRAGAVEKVMGKFIGKIPKVKERYVDEKLIEKGSKMRSSAKAISEDTIGSFASVGNPGVAGLLQQMETMEIIYIHTTEICFDKENLYLVAE